MRRGTEPAINFGKWLCSVREQRKMSMGAVAKKIGAPAATVSQVEKGQRALKEPKIKLWAEALGVNENTFYKMWKRYDDIPVGPVVRRRSKSSTLETLEKLISDLTGPERTRVQGYIEAIIESR